MLTFSEACERNRAPILDVLRLAFANSTQVLEIGSGTGQHAVHFAAQLPQLTWQPTEQPAYLDNLNERIRLEGTRNLLPAAPLDVKQRLWPLRRADAVFTANTLHIMSWQAVIALFQGVARLLPADGVLCVYGPFRYAGRYTSASNRDFDQLLQGRDPLSGLRDLDALQPLATAAGLRLAVDHDLPANNRLLQFIKG